MAAVGEESLGLGRGGECGSAGEAVCVAVALLG
jgi:hypothetical protein